MSRAALLGLALLGCGCDVARPWPEPEPGLERMVRQERGQPYSANAFFADGKSMRAPPAGVVPYTSQPTGAPAAPLDAAAMARGREHFRVICATCHGEAGDGESPVAARMELRKPPSLHDPLRRALSDERLFQIVSDGYGLMPGYAGMLEPSERWAVIGYLRALQLSRSAKLSELPVSLRTEALESLR